MATTATPYGTKPGYVNGAGVPYEEPPLRAHRVHHCLNFILRVLTALATGAAIVTILKSNETVIAPNGVAAARARWNDFGAFKYVSLVYPIANLLGFHISMRELIPSAGYCLKKDNEFEEVIN